ncbi:hypothetical protein Q4Q35_19300 [Flavivirga aquimarina]|uniref:DUF4230 domain-containing protein n=1 Tax=Flavivirga aquimarina TaxID=2027862 RepID=A0ABT8WFM5_9FLAO|nr:hypothetical protein [Flavivirga aquimarina]MDO5971953.1 hypothetical protein [Flavivirga aquimarina]
MNKRNFKLDWKYIVREVLLIFIGINLAIWFNNWNTNKKANQDKEVVVSKIKEEITNNSIELDKARLPNQKIEKAFKAYSMIYNKSSSEIIVTPKERIQLEKEYPNFFKVKDSIQFESQKYLYTGDTFIELEIPDITSIAWETIRTINIANEFDYNCLYELESMYNLQERVKKEIDKAADALQEGDLKKLFKILNVINQLDTQLKLNYDDVLESIDDCK